MPFQSSHEPKDDLIGSVRSGLPSDFGIRKETKGWKYRSPNEERESEDYRYFEPDADDRLCDEFQKQVHVDLNQLSPEEVDLQARKKKLGFEGPAGELKFQQLKAAFLKQFAGRLKQKKGEPAWVRDAQQWVRDNTTDAASFDRNVDQMAMEATQRERALEASRRRKKKMSEMPGLVASLNCLSKWNDQCVTSTREFMHHVTEITAEDEDNMDPRLEEGNGDRWFDRALKCFDRMPIKPTPIQKEFLKRHFLYVNLPHIYQHEFLHNKLKLLQRLRRDRFHKAAFLTCPRQFGKSTTTAMGAASLLYVGRGINIVMVANSQGSATDLMRKTMNNFVAIAGTERVIYRNQKMCCVTRADVPDNTPKETIIQNGWFNTVRACSGNAKTQRGINASVIILDEAAFINQAMLEEVIGPLIKVRNTTIIALSTHSGGENWFSRIFKRRDKQIERLVTRMQVKFMCDDCENRGFRTCEHMRHLQPKWHDAESKELIQLFISNEDLYAQEIMGQIISSNDGCIFSHNFMDTMFSRPRAPIEKLKNKLLLTFIDPKGNSEHTSYFAICTVLLTSSDSILLVGMDETQASLGLPKEEFLRNYFSALAHHPIYDNNTAMIVTTESNYSATESYIWTKAAIEVIQPVHPNSPIYEYRDEENKAGARTYEKSKMEAASMLLSDFLCSSVYICPNFVCSKESKRGEIQRSFIKQATSLKVHPNGRIHAKDGKAGHDDMIIVFMMAVRQIKECNQFLSYEAVVQHRMEDPSNHRAHGHFVSPVLSS